MYLNRLLAINMATLAALGTLLLGMAQENMLLPLVMLLAASVSVWLNDITGRFRINRRVANAGMLVALYASLVLVFGPGKADLAIYFANLLACVQIILLFVQKDTRVWWHLALLSLIQVCVATAYSRSMLFGGLLVAYLFLGLSTMALIFLRQERAHYRLASRTLSFAGLSVSSAVRPKQDWVRLAKIAMITSVTGPLSLFLTYAESPDKGRPVAPPPTPDVGSGRWPLAGQVSTFTSSAAGTGGSAGFGWELWFRLAAMTAWTLLLAAVVFVAVPRTGFSVPFLGSVRWEGGRSGVRRSVGFTDSVRLGELGAVIQDPEKVLDVELTDHRSGAPYSVDGEVYIRGAVLTRYEEGNWGHDEPARPYQFGLQRLRQLPSTDGLVRQEIKIELMDRHEVFCVWPPVFLPETERVAHDTRKQTVYRTSRSRRTFVLGTTAFPDGKQAQFIPADVPVDVHGQRMLSIQNELPNLVRQAKTWIDESGVPESDPIARARVLEGQFRDSGGFQYRLGGVDREYGIDPIEDFIGNNRVGHCEYFSTALTLMLRSQKIPSRMIVGYKSGDYDSARSSFRVRQWDAHTWVEAYISPEQVRALGELPGPPNRDWRHGGWLRLDPTPAAAEDYTGIAALVKGVGNWKEWITSVWHDYVIGMDSSRQRELVYEPLTAALKVGADGSLVDPNWWRDLFRELTGLPARCREFLAEGRWFSWRGRLVAMVLAAVLCAAYRCIRLLVLLVAARLTGSGAGGMLRQRARIRFYLRLEAVLKRHGLNRTPSQTQREFAARAARRMVQSAEVGDLADLPDRVTDAFYQVRFGDAVLDNRQAEEVEQALRRLEASDGW